MHRSPNYICPRAGVSGCKAVRLVRSADAKWIESDERFDACYVRICIGRHAFAEGLQRKSQIKSPRKHANIAKPACFRGALPHFRSLDTLGESIESWVNFPGEPQLLAGDALPHLLDGKSVAEFAVVIPFVPVDFPSEFLDLSLD